MPVAQHEQTDVGGGGGGAASTALKAAAAAAATGAATYAVKRVRAHDDDGGADDGEERESRSKPKRGGSQGIFASAAATGWSAASDALTPLAEDAAEAAGKYLAEHGPELVREHLIPKFIEAFNEAA